MRNTREFPYMIFHQLFDEESSTFTYFIANACSRKTIVIDPVKSKVDEYLKLIHNESLILDQILDTHVHADHITGGASLSSQRRSCFCWYAAAEKPPRGRPSARVLGSSIVRTNSQPAWSGQGSGRSIEIKLRGATVASTECTDSTQK